MSEINKHTSTPSPLRLGVVGAGQIAGIILPMLADRPVTVTGVTDVNASAAQSLSTTASNAPVFATADELLNDLSTEAVYLATPPNTHKPLVMSALKAGKHVICEKPWTLNADEARDLLSLTRAHPKLLVGCCSSRFCFTPAAQTARRFVAENALGKLRQVRLFSTGNPPSPLDQLPQWKQRADTAGGGLSSDWGVYELEWIRATLGSHFVPVEVTAWLSDWKREGSGLDSGYHAVIRCDSGLEVVLARQSEVGPRHHQIEMRGETGGLDVPFAPDAKDNIARLHRLNADGKTLETTAASEPTTSWDEILCGPIVNLAEAVRNQTEIAAPPSGQIVVHTLLDAIYRSGREHHTISIKL